jgi:hypothetical protein
MLDVPLKVVVTALMVSGTLEAMMDTGEEKSP